MKRNIMFSSLLIVTCLASAARAVEAPAPMIGYRGDGTGLCRGANPPTKELAVKWETSLPSWGHCSPIAVGNKVFVLCEPYPAHYFPQLLCLDGATGKVLWERELDHLAAVKMTDAERDAARKEWADLFEDVCRRRRLIAPLLKAKKANDEAAQAAAEKALTDAGCEYNGRWTKVDLAPKEKDKEFGQRLRKLGTRTGIGFDTWYYGCGVSINCLGNAYATPVSDGQRIYVTTAFGSVFCFDVEGKQQWCTWTPIQRSEYCVMGRSPLLHRGQLLTAIGNVVRAFSTDTGKPLWSHALQHSGQGIDTGGGRSHSILTPVVITVGGQDILFAPGVTAYRLPDGQSLKVADWSSEGFEALVNSDHRDVLFVNGQGQHCSWNPKEGRESPAAVQFAFAGDTLKATVLWDGVGGTGKRGGGPLGMVYHDGKLFTSDGMVVDSLTGKPIAGLSGPSTYHLLQMGEKHLVGFNRGKSGAKGGVNARSALLSVYTLDGKLATSLTLTRTPHTPAQRESLLACSANEEWGNGFTHGWTFTLTGDRIYVRSLMNLICVGAK